MNRHVPFYYTTKAHPCSREKSMIIVYFYMEAFRIKKQKEYMYTISNDVYNNRKKLIWQQEIVKK